MTGKKKSRNNNKKRTVQQQARGPTSVPKARVIRNGRTESQATHHLMDIMGRKGGISSRAAKQACENMVDPMNTGPCVVTSGLAKKINTSGYETATVTPMAGSMISSKKTFTVAVGTTGYGFLIVEPACAGFEYYKDVWYSTAAWSGVATPAANATGITSDNLATSIYLNSTPDLGTFSQLQGCTLEVVRNDQDPSVRNGSVYAFRCAGDGGTLTEANFKANPHANQFSTLLFDEGSMPSMICQRPTTWFSCTAVAEMKGVDYGNKGWVEGFFFVGDAGDTFDVTVSAKIAYYGWNIPVSVNHMLDTSAVECAVACTASSQIRQIGHFSEQTGRRRRDVRKAADHHTAATTGAGVMSAIWPVVKQLAIDGGGELLRSLI